MTPNEFESIAEAFHREEERPGSPRFEVIATSLGFMANVKVGGVPVAVVGGSRMPNGDVSPWVVTASNEKRMLVVEPFERSRDLVRRLIVEATKLSDEPTIH